MARRRQQGYTAGSPPTSTKFKEAVMEETGGMTPFNVKQHNLGQRYRKHPKRITPSMSKIKARGGY